MNIKRLLIPALVFYGCISTVMAMPISGSVWVSNDEKTGVPRAEFQLDEHDGVLTGRVVAIHKQPGDTGICSECPGKFKDKPIQNMVIIWGLTQHGKNNWSGGKILDPKTGKIYRAKLLFKGDKLYVRGYIGVSVLGRTQVWDRRKVS